MLNCIKHLKAYPLLIIVNQNFNMFKLWSSSLRVEWDKRYFLQFYPSFFPFQALWMMDPKEISDWQHEEFYRYVAQAYDKPRYTLHYRADAPLNIRSIFYVPESVRSVRIYILMMFLLKSS